MYSTQKTPIYYFMLILVGMLLAGMSYAQTPTPTSTDVYYVSPTLPAYMYIECDTDLKGGPANDSLISTTAKMMDWCGCENKLNPEGLAYAGMSVYDDSIPANEPLYSHPARTWACSANANAACDSETDWYHALGNVSAACGASPGYFYDAQRQMAWGFSTYWDTKFCESVAWVGIS